MWVRLADITVEVRDKALARRGLISPEHLHLKYTGAHNNVGSWELRLPVDHRLTRELRTPGAGIIVSGPGPGGSGGSVGSDVLFSGPVTGPEVAVTTDDPGGTATFEGVTDNVLLADMLAFPDPATADPMMQTRAYDTRTGPAETLIHAFLSANIGPAAPAGRRRPALTMGPNLARGPSTRKSARFDVLGSLLTELATAARLGFRIVQRGTVLVFETYQVADRSLEIRLDVRNGTLTSQRVTTAPPGVTRAIVAGQGDGADRTILAATTAESVAAETAWGRRIERFIDQRHTDNLAELQQAADELLAEEGTTLVDIEAIPTDDTPSSAGTAGTGGGSMVFGTDWYLGDTVAVVVDDQELKSIVTGCILKADSTGFRQGAVIGKPSRSPHHGLNQRLQAVHGRVSALERNTSTSPGMSKITATSWLGANYEPVGDDVTYPRPLAWYDPTRRWIEVELYVKRRNTNTAATNVFSDVVTVPATPVNYRPALNTNATVTCNIGGTERQARCTLVHDTGALAIVLPAAVVWSIGQFAFIRMGWRVA